MRLKKIKIVNFGKFSNQTFDLADKNIDIFFGENEAGKSTLVAFIKQVLFGFYLKNIASSFFENYIPLANVSPMGGSLIFEDEAGNTFELERLYAKGNKSKKGNLTVKKNDERVPVETFFDQIQNINGNFYADSFIFNQETMRQILGLSQADLLERIYFLGMPQSNRLLELRDLFDKQAKDQFKKTGKKPIVNQLLVKVDEDQATLADKQVEFTNYQENQTKLVEQQNQLKQLRTKATSLQQQIENLTKLEQQLENYRQLKELKKQEQVIAFDHENYQKGQNLQAEIKSLELNQAASQQDLKQIDLLDVKFVNSAKSYVQKRPELLHWQSQRHFLEQKDKQLEQNLQGQLNFNPALEKMANYTQADFEQMKQDLPEVIPASNNKNGQMLLYGSIALAVVLGILLKLVGLGIGLVLIAAAFIYWKNQQLAIDKQQKLQAQKLANFKSKYGIEVADLDLGQLQLQVSQYQAKLQERVDNQAELDLIDQNVDHFAGDLAILLDQQLSSDIEALLAILDSLAKKLAENQYQQERQESLNNTMKITAQKLKELKLQLDVIFAHDQVASFEDYKARYQAYLDQTALKAKISALSEVLADDLDKLDTYQEADLKAEVEKLEAEKRQLEEEINLAQTAVAQIEVKQENIANSKDIFLSKQNLANSQSELAQASQEYLANLLAARLIDRALELASNERFPKMLQSAKEYFKILTGERYLDILFKNKLEVVRCDGKKVKVEFLSRATAEQLYFAVKLAFIEQIADKINLPILIDDSFVNFDDQRIGYIEKLLKKISKHNQVLIFTAQRKLTRQLDLETVILMKGSTNV